MRRGRGRGRGTRGAEKTVKKEEDLTIEIDNHKAEENEKASRDVKKRKSGVMDDEICNHAARDGESETEGGNNGRRPEHREHPKIIGKDGADHGIQNENAKRLGIGHLKGFDAKEIEDDAEWPHQQHVKHANESKEHCRVATILVLHFDLEERHVQTVKHGRQHSDQISLLTFDV